MKLSIVRIDKKHVTHLTVKPIEWFLERIKTDTKSEDIGKFRQHIAHYGDTTIHEDNTSIAMIYPLVEMVKTENGNLEITAFNSLIWLHIQGLMTGEEIKAHNRQYQLMPPAVQYFNEYYEPAVDETEGTWLSPTAIYDHLRQMAGAGLKTNGVSIFGRYLWNMPELQHRRVGSSKQYLVKKK